MRIPTVKVVNPEDKNGGFTIINKSDYDADQKGEKKYKLWEGEEPENADEGGAVKKPTNTSGTFDEPTPTDIRYGNKDNTEFENNHGAFVGASAAEMREAVGAPQKPGGLNPEVHEEVAEAEAQLRNAVKKAAEPTKKSVKPSKVRRIVEVDDEDDAQDNADEGKKKGGKKKGGKDEADTADTKA